MRVLLVDDDEAGRELLAGFMEEHLGHNVTQCPDGNSALEEYNRKPYPLVVTDIRMPGMNGVKLLKEIRSTPGGQATDVVLITAYDENSTISEAFRQGAFEYMIKPIRLREFEDVIQRVVDHQHKSGPQDG
jgi:two-component system, NtrC family, response regulator AtoC